MVMIVVLVSTAAQAVGRRLARAKSILTLTSTRAANGEERVFME
jgi:hypothetical protein